MEARDGLCRAHWSFHHLHGKIRRDIAARLPIEFLDDEMMAELRTLLPAYDWRWVCRVSGHLLHPAPPRQRKKPRKRRSRRQRYIMPLDYWDR